MSIKQAISLTIHKNNMDFINDFATKRKMTKSEIIDNIIDAYRKYRLKKEIIAGFKSQNSEDVHDAMSDFSDYLDVIENK